MSKPLFIMLVGLPGCGKSTFRADAQFDGMAQLSTDDIVEEYAVALGQTYDAVWGSRIKVATAEFQLRLTEALRARKSVVIDRTNLTVRSRKGYLAQVPKDYFKMAIYFEIDEGLRQERIHNRPGKTIPRHVDSSMVESYVRPTMSEGFDFVSSSVVEGLLAA